MKKSIIKKFWYDEYSGGFNWALVAIFAFVGIFLYNVITATVIIPQNSQSKNINTIDKKHTDHQEYYKNEESPIKLPDSENDIKL